jgi:hypothetical protein
MSLISTRLAAICLTFPMTAALSAQTIADARRQYDLAGILDRE